MIMNSRNNRPLGVSRTGIDAEGECMDTQANDTDGITEILREARLPAQPTLDFLDKTLLENAVVTSEIKEQCEAELREAAKTGYRIVR
jgi:hypothetical protein